ncbi:MAG TPA: hypothetical protein VMB03_10925 [Bryobacteraceae bacterium]|nr:hypothetical protein [Bryobacteraceae bacterium]
MTNKGRPFPQRFTGPTIFLLAFLLLFAIAAKLLEIAGDEGIYLEGGRRIAVGQQAYRDFFILTGPLTFWIEGVLARLSGPALVIMRLPMIVDAAFLVWAVYWLISRYAGELYSAGAALVFLAYQSQTRLLFVNHRWDSGALATAAVIAALAAWRLDRRIWWIFSGSLTAAAAWATPSIAILAAPLLFWSLAKARSEALAWLAGGAMVTGACTSYLALHRALVPMIHSLAWTAANYTAPNRVSYGNVWAGAAPHLPVWQYLPLTLLHMIPALLPPAAILGWIFHCRKSGNRDAAPEIWFLLAAAAALTLAAWPRWSSDTLLHTLALSWFLGAWLLYRVTTPAQRFWWSGAVLLVAAGTLASKALAPLNYPSRETRVGSLLDPYDSGAILENLENLVQPGDTLFSFPYLPSAYFYLDARNPSRYTFLQPGMMNREDERRAVEELKADPPRWVLYENFPAEAVFRIWPESDPARIPMAALNGYIRQHYRQVDTAGGVRSRLILLERAPTGP